MDLPVYSGNAAVDGERFNHWFVGDLHKWCSENGAAFDPQAMGLRDTGRLEVKWGRHPKGQQRPGGWAKPSEKTCLSLLVQGAFLLRFRIPGGSGGEIERRLAEQGDYVIWKEEVEHTWQAEEDAVILTIRWREGEAGEER